MAAPHLGSDSEDELDVGNPLQVRLTHLFAVTTMCALVLAIVSPIIRHMRSESRWTLVVVICGQAALVTFVMYWAARRRQKLLTLSGRRIGVGYCGELTWKHWPLARSIGTMLLVAATQLFFAVAVSLNPAVGLASPGFLLQQTQLGLIFGIACSRFTWRVLPNSMEFFDNGVSLDGTRLIPWERITVRDSQFFPDRIVVVARTFVGSLDADTIVVQVHERLRRRVATLC